jgi:lipopolysaccharide export system protein LptA
MKNILKIIIGITLLAICVYFLVSIQVKQEVSSSITSPDFMMEFSGVRLRGWNNDKINWEMQSTKAYYYDKNSLVMLGVNNGFFLDANGKNLIEELRISTVDANIIRKEFILNGVSLKINAKTQDDVYLKAERLKYFDGILSAESKYLLSSGQWQITSGKMNFNILKNIMEFSNKMTINKGKSSLNSETGTFFPALNSISLSGDVKIIHFITYEKKDHILTVFSDEADVLLNKDEPEFIFSKGMIFRLGEDVLEARYGRYEPNYKVMKMKDVLIRVNDGSTILNNIDAKEIKGSVIRAKVVDIDFKEKKLQLSGNVSYEREKRRILSQVGIYDVDSGMLFMSGGVSIVEGNKTIRANNVMVDVKNDVITAKGNVKTKLKI